MAEDDLRKQLAELDAEIARVGRDCEAAELYGDIGPRYQRMLRRIADLQRERAQLSQRSVPSDAETPPSA